jgi:predicted Zn-dependent protease
MRFSNSIREVDGKPEFCGRCRAILRENLGIFKAKK